MKTELLNKAISFRVSKRNFLLLEKLTDELKITKSEIFRQFLKQELSLETDEKTRISTFK